MVGKIAVITGSRAEYGLLEPLIKRFHEDPDLEPLLFVTGSHLSHEFGHTIDHIKYPISATIENVLSSDTPVGIAKSMGLAMISFGEVYERFKPDLVVCLGDRYELFTAISVAHVARIPVSHIHGGEVTEGAYDDAFRHSITKMSQIHFVAAEPYQKRVIQLGEHPDTVFNVGALGCEGFIKRTNWENYKHLILCYYGQGKLEIPSEYIITKISGSHDVDHYYDHSDLCALSRMDFVYSLLRADAILGNSSVGIIEAPALGVPTINIGDRQKGRLMADSIIQAEPNKVSIGAAFDKLYSPEFQAMMQTEYHCPYQGRNVAEKIHTIIKERLPGLTVNKVFYDLT